MCHLALLMPVFGLAVFFPLPFPAALALYLVIVAASALLYKAVLDAMRRRVVTGREALLGARAAVQCVDGGRLVVSLRGELWTARAAGYGGAAPRPGERAAVRRVRGSVLVVEPAATRPVG